MLKIGICGSHGTGKSTLAAQISKQLKLPVLDKTMRTMWQNFGISDFEKLPPDVRQTFQMYAILAQIEREDSQENFVTDRTVLDNLAYTKYSTSISVTELKIYEALVKERLKNYTHFIYAPVEFEAEKEHLRAYPESQLEIAKIMEEYLSSNFKNLNYLKLTGSVENRLKQIFDFLKKPSTNKS